MGLGGAQGGLTAQLPYGAGPERRQMLGVGWNGWGRSGIGAQRGLMPHRDLDVLHAAELVADQINALADRPAPRGRRLLHVTEMRDSSQSIAANIAEGFGRGTDRDRARSLRIARGEAEETIRHVGANFRADRITPKVYWPIHNRLVTIVKMLDSLLHP